MDKELRQIYTAVALHALLSNPRAEDPKLVAKLAVRTSNEVVKLLNEHPDDV